MFLYLGFWEGEKGKVDRGYHDSKCFDFLNRENDAKKKGIMASHDTAKTGRLKQFCFFQDMNDVYTLYTSMLQ